MSDVGEQKADTVDLAGTTFVQGTAEDARPVFEAAEQHDGSAPVSDQALLAVAQGQRTLFLVANASGATVGAGVIGQGEIDVVVSPEHRGKGLGTLTLQHLLVHSSENSAGEVLAWAHGENPSANALLARAGFTPVRSLYRMALDPELLPPAGTVAEVPEGFILRTFDPALSNDAAEWVRVNAAAFASHPEQGRITEQDFALLREEPWYRDDDLILLFTEAGSADAAPGTSALAGSTWIKTVHHGAPVHAADTNSSAEAAPANDDSGSVETELYAVGVDPAFTGRGLGRVLLNATLARMAEHEPAKVTLYVDGENERAVRMYESAGFTVENRSKQWKRVLVNESEGTQPRPEQ